jgi:hypothetical protein
VGSSRKAQKVYGCIQVLSPLPHHGNQITHKRSTDHCLEILRMNVQCNADVGVFTLYMLEGDPAPWPELNSWHVCRNFDAVLDWAMENSVGIMEKHENNTNSR